MNSIYEEIRVALHAVWKRRWLALAIAWAVCLIGWLMTSMIPNKYQSQASIFVQAQTLLPEKMGVTKEERRADIENISQTLTSTENMEKVVRGTDLAQLVASQRDVTNMAIGLRKSIKVNAVQDNLFEISAESGSGSLSNAQNAKLSRDIVQKLLDLFVEGNLAGGRTETAQTLKFLDTQIAQREVQLQAAETKRVEFERKYVGLLPGTGSASQRMETARSELAQVESSLMTAQGALVALNAQMSSTPATVTQPGSAVGGGPGRAAGIEAQISDAQSRGLTEAHPDMISMRRQLASARAADRSSGGSRVIPGVSSANPMYGSLRSMLAERQASVGALSARKAQLQAEMGQYQSKQIEEPAVAAEQARINRDYDVLKDAYDKLLSDREEVRLRGSLQKDTDSLKVRIIEPPSLPTMPASPNRPLFLTLILLVGLAVGAGVAFGLSQLKTSYATAGRLERASGLPVIGSIHEITTPVQRADRRKKLKYFAGAAGALVALFAILQVVEAVQRAMVA